MKRKTETDIIEWDVLNWSLALRFWKRNTLLHMGNANALEVGSRNGGLALWAAVEGAKVLCTDVGGPTGFAREKHERYGVSERIDYGELDILNIPFQDRFDIVLLKSVLGAVGRGGNIENQKRAVHQMHKCLRKGGELFFAENLVASPVHQYLRGKYVPWGNSWRYVSRAEMLEFLSIFSEVRYITAGFFGAFGRNERQRAVLGALDRAVLSRLFPKDWRYIMIGVARK